MRMGPPPGGAAGDGAGPGTRRQQRGGGRDTERSPLLSHTDTPHTSSHHRDNPHRDSPYREHSRLSRRISEKVETVTMTLKEYLAEIKVPVYILTMLFAIASWVDINGVWTQMPLMVNALPEGWNLPSYLTIIIQVANIGPIAYTVANRLAPHKVTEWPVVYIIIVVGAVSCALLVFFWDATSYIGGTLHSTGLLTLTGFLSLVDCTSSVVFLPYMAHYRPHYMTAYYIGEGLSGMIPGLVGLAQGLSQDPICVNTSVVNSTDHILVPHYPPPRFSIEAFFWMLFGMMCISGVSFTLLHWLKYCQTERIQSSVSFDLPGGQQQTGDNLAYEPEHSEEKFRPIGEDKIVPENTVGPQYYGTSSSSEFSSKKHLSVSFPEGGSSPQKLYISKGQFAFYLTMVGVACAFTNGVLPAIQSYACLPYGNLAYTLAIRVASVANPIACFVALFAPPVGVVGVAILSFLGSALSGYQIFLASASPNPPMQDETIGLVLCVSITYISNLFNIY